MIGTLVMKLSRYYMHIKSIYELKQYSLNATYYIELNM